MLAQLLGAEVAVRRKWYLKSHEIDDLLPFPAHPGAGRLLLPAFVARPSTSCCWGPPGSGKTHLAAAFTLATSTQSTWFWDLFKKGAN